MLKSSCFAAQVNFLFYILCALQNQPPCAAKTECNFEYFVVSIFFMKSHYLFTRPVINPPNPFQRSALNQAD